MTMQEPALTELRTFLSMLNEETAILSVRHIYNTVRLVPEPGRYNTLSDASPPRAIDLSSITYHVEWPIRHSHLSPWQLSHYLTDHGSSISLAHLWDHSHASCRPDPRSSNSTASLPAWELPPHVCCIHWTWRTPPWQPPAA